MFGEGGESYLENLFLFFLSHFYDISYLILYFYVIYKGCEFEQIQIENIV